MREGQSDQPQRVSDERLAPEHGPSCFVGAKGWKRSTRPAVTVLTRKRQSGTKMFKNLQKTERRQQRSFCNKILPPRSTSQNAVSLITSLQSTTVLAHPDSATRICCVLNRALIPEALYIEARSASGSGRSEVSGQKSDLGRRSSLTVVV